MKKIVLFVSALGFIATLSVTGLDITPVAQAASAQPTNASQPALTQVRSTFSIEKMSCAACPITVRKAMARVDGVAKVTVDFNKKTAAVIYDPKVATIEQISAASTNAGYPATLEL